ncbi:glycosyltransferase family 4 protein [Thalassoroseus pseudoceratinae]|uniref:glycosyltransferase family 4 protein n=1 Tax=Thalassoroseus pseudoceratinae TaxID=2713176 RepID=UPI00141DBB4F|nr:glycosyltransferase family 4 protein [Thalassoroseus pseudoceratinae]
MPSMLVVVPSFPVVTQTFVLREIVSIRDAGWEVHVLTCSTGDATAWDQAKHFGISQEHVHVLNWRTCKLFSIRTVMELSKPIARKAADFAHYGFTLGLRRLNYFHQLSHVKAIQSVDIVHCHFTEAAADTGVGLAQILKRPLTILAHDSFLEKASATGLRKIQRAASIVFCVSKGWVKVWEKATGSNDKLQYMPNSIDIDEFESAATMMAEKSREVVPRTLRAITIGHFHGGKRQGDLVRAAALLKEEGVCLNCTMVGDGPERREVEALAVKYGIETQVVFLGSLTHREVREQLVHADVLVHCSQQESFGIVIIEAMGASLPVVASHTIGADDSVLENVTGHLYKVGDIGTLARRLADLAKDRQRLHSLGLAGRKRVEKLFAWDNRMAQMFNEWQSVIRIHRQNLRTRL